MARITHRETYILRLLNVRKEISDRIDVEIGEIFHDRGMNSDAFIETLIDFIEDEFDRMKYRKETLDHKNDTRNDGNIHPLEKIKQVCESKDKCDDCPYYSRDFYKDCIFRVAPMYWSA